MPKAKQEKETPSVCVCGNLPVTVKCRTGYILACPDLRHCSVRSRWTKQEQAAIHEWNVAVKEARRERRSS